MSQSRHILDPQHRSRVVAFAHRKLLVALDFDGVLAAIAPSPAEAHVGPSTLRLASRDTRKVGMADESAKGSS